MKTVEAHLDRKELTQSVKESERLYEQEGFNEQADFGMLRGAAMDHGDL